jgi:peroxiredoxin family protein
MSLNKLYLFFGILSFFLILQTTNYAYAQNMTNATSSVQDITYTAKFVCGSIPDDSGPLRPGHYDTAISILNKKNYEINILWNAVINDGPASNAILKTLDSEKSTGITCMNIKDVFGITAKEIVEGFVIIRVPVDSLRGFDNEQIISDYSQDALNLLDVQVFYTANALSTLPHEVAQEKISFYIIQDFTNKIPKESFRKSLDVTLPSTLNELSDTEQKVKFVLAKKYDLDNKDLEKIIVRIKSISVGVGALLDDHAISLHIVKPQINS